MRDRYLFWLALAVPAGYQLIGYLTGTVVYGEVLHLSGDLAVQLMVVTLSVTPLCIVFPRVSCRSISIPPARRKSC
jgi:hypothetical protein